MFSWQALILTCILPVWLNDLADGQNLEYYYAAPKHQMRKYFGNSSFSYKQPVRGGKTNHVLPEYRFVKLDTRAAIDSFHVRAPVNIRRTYDSLTTDAELGRRADEVMELSGGVVDVKVYLVNDLAGVSEEDSYFDTAYNQIDSTWFVWPAARNWKVSSGRYAGDIALGERAAWRIRNRPGDQMAWEATILHELFHTQFIPDDKHGYNIWGNLAISYGGDAGHWGSELLADLQIPMDEGMATFFGTLHNVPLGADALIEFCDDPEPRFRLGNRSFLSMIAEMWDSPHVIDKKWTMEASKLPKGFLNTSITEAKGPYELRVYRWHDVPGRFVMFNESMNTAFFYLFWEWATEDPETSLGFIRNAAEAMSAPNVYRRNYAFAANLLAKSLEAYAKTDEGREDEEMGRLRSSMFVYGLLDLLTHFGMAEGELKKVLSENAQGKTPGAFDRYWAIRDDFKKQVGPYIDRSSIKTREALFETVQYFTKRERIVR